MSSFYNSRIGFMQGRLSELVDGRIQAFPWDSWQTEFFLAKKIGIQLMEWTIDSRKIESNPILLSDERASITKLSRSNDISISSVTDDFFMENPPWNSDIEEIDRIHRNILAGMEIVGSRILVVPLVDNSSILDENMEAIFFEFIAKMESTLRKHSIKIAIESDFEPEKLSKFISNFDPEIMGINYDIGNSASLGFDSDDELNLYGDRVINVHVKDRLLGGTTVPLGSGNANLPKTIQLLERVGYKGNYVLQTARSQDGKHAEAIVKYANMVEEWLHEC